MEFIRKNKALLIIIALVIVYGIIMSFVLKKNNTSSSSDKSITPVATTNYLIINNISNWKLQNNKWSKVSNSDIENLNVSFKAFVNNNYLGEFTLRYGTKWNLLDSNKNIVNYNGDLMAFSNEFNLNIRHNAIRKMNNDDESTVTNKFNITDFSNIIENEVIETDLDNNGTKDEIVSISNIGGEVSLNNYFNLVYINLNGNIYELINEKISASDVLNAKNYYLTSVINYNNNATDSVIIGYEYYSNAGNPGNIMFNYNDNNFNKIMSD
jgi:hypothetical protein